MTIEKLPSGKYRIRQMYHGHRYSITLDYKPNKKEAEKILYAEIQKNGIENSDSFESCANKYIEAKSRVLSPSTLGEYSLKINRLSDEFLDLSVDSIGRYELQSEINRLAERLAPKTVKDMNGFIQAVLFMFQTRPQRYSVTLPQARKNVPYIPSNDDVKAVLNVAKDTHYYIALRLGLFGLRRSEICCITSDDLDGCVLHVNKALVQNKATKEWIVKSTKTTESERDIIIPKDLADDIRRDGKAFDGYPGTISNYLSRTQKKLGLPHFSLHKERHFFASYLAEIGVDPASIQKMGGWSTDHVMKTVYTHSRIMEDQKRQKAISDQIAGDVFL